MKTPICSFDARTGILCPKCETKLKSGHLTKTDVEVSVKLSKMAERFSELDKATLLKALEVDGDYVIVLGAGDLGFIRRDLGFIRRMEEEFQRKVWLVEGETTDRKFLEDVFFPIRILTVNIVWLPDGSKLTKVIIPGRKTERFPLDLERVKKVVKSVRGIDLLVEFERS